MKKQEIARRLAKRSGLSKAAAADRLDRVVNRILSNLRKGQNAPLPGLGTFTAGPKWGFQTERNDCKGDSGRGVE
jgi:nucleoid DNA-binding protein